MSIADDIKAAAALGEADIAAKRAAEKVAELAADAKRVTWQTAQIPANDAWVREHLPGIVRELMAKGIRGYSSEDEGIAQAMVRAGLNVKWRSYDVSKADDMYPDTRWYWTVSW